MTEPQSIVFVVDDEASIRKALDSLIRSVGLTVQLFGSAQEFLQAKRPDVPSCLILDVRLPGISGLDFQRKLIEFKVSIPIIFITGHGDIPMSVRAMKDGAVRLEVKAFDVQDAAVTRLHDHGNPAITRRLADEEFDIQRVALFDDQIKPVNEAWQILIGDAFGERRHL